MKKAWVIVMVARQIGGEYCLIRAEKAFSQASKAEEYLNKIRNDYKDVNGKFKAIRLTTPVGDVDCMLEAGAFEIDIEE